MEQGDKPRVFEVHTDLDCLQTWRGLKEVMPNFMSFMCYTAKLLSIEEQHDIWKTQRAQMLHTKRSVEVLRAAGEVTQSPRCWDHT